MRPLSARSGIDHQDGWREDHEKWRKEGVPPSFLSGAPRTDPQTPEEKAAEEKYRTGPGAWFVKTGCFVCHSISVFGVKSPAQIGPDLSMAVEDVQARFGRTVDDFLAVLSES